MNNWKMVTLIGEDQPGIVAKTTDVLYQNGLTLGETSMMRLGGNFSMMMMVSGTADLHAALAPVTAALNLHLHVDDVVGQLHQHVVPNIQVRVMGADQPGIVARVTGVLAASGFNILELESDVAGTAQNPVYIMTIQGVSEEAVETLQQAVDGLGEVGVDVTVSAIETMFA